MDITGFTAIRKRLSASPNQSQMKLPTIVEATNSSLDDVPPDYRGTLKSFMKVQYEFNSQLTPEQDDEDMRTQKINPSQTDSVKSVAKKNGFFTANLFSCMDAPDYQRDFQISPVQFKNKQTKPL